MLLSAIPEEYRELIDDMLKLITIIALTLLLMRLDSQIRKRKAQLHDYMMYIALSLFAYHLVIKKALRML